MKNLLTILVLSLFGWMVSAATVDTAASSFTWKATKKVSKGHYGKIFLKSSSVKMAGDKISQGEFVMNMATFTVDDLEGTWEKKFLGHVKSGDFFDIAKFPTAKLVIDGQSGSALNGKLTIKDKTHPVKVSFKKSGKTYTGTLKFDRTKFGMTYNSGNFFKDLAADKVINDEVTLDFKVVLK